MACSLYKKVICSSTQWTHFSNYLLSPFHLSIISPFLYLLSPLSSIDYLPFSLFIISPFSCWNKNFHPYVKSRCHCLGTWLIVLFLSMQENSLITTHLLNQKKNTHSFQSIKYTAIIIFSWNKKKTSEYSWNTSHLVFKQNKNHLIYKKFMNMTVIMCCSQFNKIHCTIWLKWEEVSEYISWNRAHLILNPKKKF